MSAFTDFVLFFCPGLSFFWLTDLFMNAFHFLSSAFLCFFVIFERNRYKEGRKVVKS